MRFALVLVALGGCRWVFGLHDLEPLPIDAPLTDDTLDAPPDSATGGCVVHGDCGSGACLPDGSCADPLDIAWVDTGGSGTACTRTAPCGSITTAIATGRKYVRVHGTIDDAVSVTTTVTILADPGSQLIRTTSGPIFMQQGSANVAIYDLELNGAPGVTGYAMQGGTLTLERCHIRACDNGALTANGTLTVSRTLIDENPGGGVMIMGGTFKITSSMIVRNGSPTSSNVGGMLINGAQTGSTLELVTIASNAVKTVGGNASAGLTCMSAFTVGHVLFAGNTINTDPNSGNANHNGLCDTTAAKTFTAIETVGFVQSSMAPYDFHLRASSAVVDQPFTSPITVDYDGDPRPIGGGFDYGADEYRP